MKVLDWILRVTEEDEKSDTNHYLVTTSHKAKEGKFKTEYECWRPRRDLNPRYRRESPETSYCQEWARYDTCNTLKALSPAEPRDDLTAIDADEPLSHFVRHRFVTVVERSVFLPSTRKRFPSTSKRLSQGFLDSYRPGIV